MAQSGKSRRSGFQHNPFVSVITGSRIESQKWLATKSKPFSVDSHFEKLTNEMKRLSVISSGKFHIPFLDPSQQIHGILGAPSPLGNSPLTGKKISIHRKNSHETMWRPSEAEPVITLDSFFCYRQPRGHPFLTFPYTWYHSEKQPGRKLLNSEHSRDCSIINGCGSVSGMKVCNVVMPPTTDLYKGNEQFYPEPGINWTKVPAPNVKSKRGTCTVSGHEPARVRVRGQAPALSVFHLFQTELIFDRTPPEIVTAGSMLTETADSSSGRDLAQKELAVASSRRDSEGTDAVCSNMSTGYSTRTHCYHRLRGDIREQAQDAPDGSSTRSKLTDVTKVHVELSSNASGGAGENKESTRLRAVSHDKDDDESCFTATSAMPEVLILDGECQSEAAQFPSYPRSSRGVLRSLSGECSEDFTKSYTLYEFDESWEKPSNVEMKLKRPPPRKFSFSKIDVHHIQSETRKDVMERLTKLPTRCQKVGQKSTDPSPPECSDQVPVSGTKSFLQPENTTPIPTIYLQLDVNVEKYRRQQSLPVPNARLLKKVNPTVKSASIERTVQGPVPSWPQTQLVFVGKGVFSSSEHKLSNNTPIWHHRRNDYECQDGVSGAFMNPNGPGKTCVKRGESSVNTSNILNNDERQTTASHNLQPSTQGGITNDVSLTVGQHVSGHTERYEYQGIAASTNESLSAWDTLSHRRCDSVSDVEHPAEFTRRHKEESAHHFSFRSPRAAAISVCSLDDVPYNSPVESPCRNNSPVSDGDFVTTGFDGQIPESLGQAAAIYPTDAENDGEGNDFCREKADVLPSGIGLNIYKGGPVLRENVSLETQLLDGDKLLSRNHQRGFKGSANQEDENAVSDSTIDLSPRSQDSDFCDYNEVISSGALYPTSEIHTQSNQTGQPLTRKTFGESLMLQQLPSLDPQVMASSLTAGGGCMHDYPQSYTRGTTQTIEGGPKKKENIPIQQELAGHVCKNVRFSDVDKVISFTVPDVVFPSDLHSFKSVGAFRTTKGYNRSQGSHPVLHKQTLQLAGYPSPRKPQKGQEMMRSNCLRDMKWSAHSYRSKYPIPNCMFIKGTSLEVQGEGVRESHPAVGNPCDASVMYTICHKCEQELNVKFGNRCSTDNDNIELQRAMASTLRNPSGNGEGPVAGVGVLCPAEISGCGHRHDGYCHLCSQISSWTAYATSGAVQREN